MGTGISTAIKVRTIKCTALKKIYETTIHLIKSLPITL
uniref:Uncharacterized protein n=1 Tax=Anguilla anguilla TaxID=7936 RepID=A0A0E9U1P2_ANGAN